MRPSRLCPALLLLAACNSSPAKAPESPAPTPPPSSFERYMPLAHDTIYSYETFAENTGEQGILVMHVQRPRPGRVDLVVAGRARRLEIVADGIQHLTGGYVLQAPLELGRSWKGSEGTVKITAVDLIIDVPAGRFVGCLETVEEAVSAVSSKKVTSMFCPDVGLVKIDVEAVSDDGYARESARLKTFGPRIDVSKM